MKRHFKNIFVFGLLAVFMGCAYYNTFFNAKARYREALKKQQSTKSVKLSNDVKKSYNEAIKKSWKLIDVYGDSNEYADDALLLIGKSYYQINDYPKAQRVLEQFILKYNQSELLADAKLYLARTHIAQGNEDDALAILNKMFESKVATNTAAEAFYILGDLYFQKEDYKKAVENLEKCADIVSDDEMFAKAQFLLGESFVHLKQYENAIQHYDKLIGLDIPVLQEYEATMKKVDVLMALKKYDQAEIVLKKILRYQRFKKHFSLIETKIGELYREQGDVQFAADNFYEVIRKYKKDEGSKLSSYYLGQLYEYNFFDFDSAKFYYDKVKGLTTYPEISEQAKKHSTVLKEYLKIRNQLRKDRRDLGRLARGDSTFTDSVEVEGEKTTKISGPDKEKPYPAGENRDRDFNNMTKGDSSTADSLKKKALAKKPKKVAVTRTAEQVQNSFLKNSFALAEFFLLKYEDYDSAKVEYSRFVKQFSDSALTPKAYYSLYYLAKDIFNDSTYADSIKKIILRDYPNSDYAARILNKKIVQKEVQSSEQNPYKAIFLSAENLRDKQQYEQAIQIFSKIADQDSGSIWAKKALYNIAFIYEKKLNNIEAAVTAYKRLLKEYPKSEFAKIAGNKTKEPLPEKPAEQPAAKKMGKESALNKDGQKDSGQNRNKHPKPRQSIKKKI